MQADDDGFRPLLDEDEPDTDTSTTLDVARALEEDFGSGLVGKAKPRNAPVYIYADDIPLATQGARTFEQDSTMAASALWHCKQVKIAQLVLLTTSSVQCLLGLLLTVAIFGIFPLASSIMGLVISIQYFVGEASSLEDALNLAFILGAIAAPLNLLFDLIYLIIEIQTEFLVPVLDIVALIFFGQTAAFLWIAVRARRVKKMLLPNSSV